MTTHYTKAQLDHAIECAKLRKRGHYGIVDDWSHQALDKYPITYDDVLVVGTCEQGFGPWYEAIAIERSQGFVWSTDYNRPTYDDPYERVISIPYPMHGYLFDTIITISTIEHSGLGRYGDTEEVDGDLKAMRHMSELLCDEGQFFLSVPLGLDKIHYPWHRIYGRERLPKLLSGWKMVDSFGYEEKLLDRDTGFGWDESNKEMPEYAPVLVLEKE